MGACLKKTSSTKVNPITSQSFHFTRSLYSKGKLIGEGAYGKVYEYLNRETGVFYAVKHMELAGSESQIHEEVQKLREEIKIFQKLSHKNIIQYLDTEIDESSKGVDIIMELVPGESLRHLINKFTKLEERMTIIYLKQVLEGLEYLHLQGIVHRDIKPANILISSNGTVKLSDFGASKKLKGDQLDNEELCNSLKGSPYWMAPEIAKMTGHSYPADIWSVGCLAIEMLSGKAPWSQETTSASEVLRMIRSGKVPKIPSGLSSTCLDFISKCLEVNPSFRPSASELLKHDFLKH
jgi:serine/threonine protein kinase